MIRDYHVIIIGGGPAGLSAACWCAELGLRALLLEARGELGGQLLWTHNAIKNHLGVEAENGRDLRDVFVRQAANFDFSRRLNAEVAAVDLTEKTVALRGGESFAAKALIIAAGVGRRRLNVAGEEEFRGRGMLESGKRDAETVRGKTVCVVGGGDAALENALILSETARRVTLVHRRAEFRARAEFVEKVRRNPKIEILTETAVARIAGGAEIEMVELTTKDDARFKIPVEAVLIRVGVRPNTELFRGQLELDAGGYIKINADRATSAVGVYAVGDAANPTAPTVSGAVGDGATAAKAVYAEFSLQKVYNSVESPKN